MAKYEVCKNCKWWVANTVEKQWGKCTNSSNRVANGYATSGCNKFEGRPLTNLEKLIETLQNAPTERTACYIQNNFEFPCRCCVYLEGHPHGTRWCGAKNNEDIFIKHPMWSAKDFCIDGIKHWLESEVNEK